MANFAGIIIDNYNKAVDVIYTYKIPEEYKETVEIGTRVVVPFGRGNKPIDGYIVDLYDDSEQKYLKQINYVSDEIYWITPLQVELAKDIKDIYLTTYIEALKLVTLSGSKIIKTTRYLITDTSIKAMLGTEHNVVEESDLHKYMSQVKITKLLKEKKLLKKVSYAYQTNVMYKEVVFLNITEEEAESALDSIPKRSKSQLKLLNYMINNKRIVKKDLLSATNSTMSSLKPLLEKGILSIEKVKEFRNPIHLGSLNMKELNTLNDEQLNVYRGIKNDIAVGNSDKFLIHGITGSGKTEVYLELCKDYINDNKQVLILVPEITLTPQTIRRFAEVFGDMVGVIHSKVSYGEKLDQWNKIKSGDIKIIIGARSAIFSPFANLGLIIMDEEHDKSYKSDTSPRYKTFDIAQWYVDRLGCSLILGSATPSIESFYLANKGELMLYDLKKRYNDSALPTVEILDMKADLMSGNKSFLSRRLLEEINIRLGKNEQVILFLNRKGFSTFLSCDSCGHVLKCPNCDISLTYYKAENHAKCSYCSFQETNLSTCPECGTDDLNYRGLGIEKACEEIEALFTNHVVKRLDSTVTSKKGSLEKILNDFDKGDIDILIGTQIVTKGLDFRNVTLVGVIATDMLLNLPDFRAYETAFQLLTQVAGRAGRSNLESKVIIQTYEPDNYALQYVKNHDYHNFFKDELSIRKAFSYPPFNEMVNIMFVSEDEDKALIASKKTHMYLEKIKEKFNYEFSINEPNQSVYAKIKNKYRYQLIIKASNKNLKILRNILSKLLIENKNKISGDDVSILIDFKPSTLM